MSDFFGQDKYDYKRMVDFMFAKWLPEMEEWEERFIKSMKAKLTVLHQPSKDEVNEFLSKNEKVKIIQVWHSVGL